MKLFARYWSPSKTTMNLWRSLPQSHSPHVKAPALYGEINAISLSVHILVTLLVILGEAYATILINHEGIPSLIISFIILLEFVLAVIISSIASRISLHRNEIWMRTSKLQNRDRINWTYLQENLSEDNVIRQERANLDNDKRGLQLRYIYILILLLALGGIFYWKLNNYVDAFGFDLKKLNFRLIFIGYVIAFIGHLSSTGKILTFLFALYKNHNDKIRNAGFPLTEVNTHISVNKNVRFNSCEFDNKFGLFEENGEYYLVSLGLLQDQEVDQILAVQPTATHQLLMIYAKEHQLNYEETL